MRVEQEFSKWDRRFFELCRLVASWSEDRRRKVGAVIVGPANQVISIGYNGLPRGISGEVEIRHRREDGEKYHWFEHAERNAIYSAARMGTSTENCRLYINLFPCADCVRGIIQSGIVEVNTFARPELGDNFDHSFDVAMTMLEEANIVLRIFPDREPTSSDLPPRTKESDL